MLYRPLSRLLLQFTSLKSLVLIGFVLISGCTRTDYAGENAGKLLDEARDQVKIFNFHITQPMFEQLSEDFEKGSDDWSESMLGLAISAWHRTPNGPEHVRRARAALEDLLASEASGARFKAEAAFMLGRIAEVVDYPTDVVDLDEAQKRYREVISTWPDEPVAREAGLRLGGSYLQQYDSPEKVREGIAVLQQWLEKYPQHEGGSLAARLIGDAYHLSLGDRDAALPWYLNAVEQGLLNTARAGNFYWLVASMAEENERDLDVAVQFYQRIITETPRSGRAFESQLRLAEMQKRYPDRNITIPEIPVYQEAMSDAASETQAASEPLPAAGDEAPPADAEVEAETAPTAVPVVEEAEAL